MALDRGMDETESLYRMKQDGRLVVVRIKDMKRDVFGNGNAIDETLSCLKFHKISLNTYRDARPCPEDDGQS